MEFDPNKALEEIRRICNTALSVGVASPTMVAINFRELDEWMSKGGHPPEAWCPISQSAHSAFHMEGRE